MSEFISFPKKLFVFTLVYIELCSLYSGLVTFASTVLLFNEVPMEIVSTLLGHSKMQTTQEHYGKIVEKKISQEMERLKGSG